MVYIQDGILFNITIEILSFSTTWVELENIVLIETYQTQKENYQIFLLICRI
jgi:hypothetical protein